MRLGRDGIAGLIGLAIALVLLPQALGLPRLPIVPVGPGFYPAIVLVALGITCALLVLQDVRAQRQLVAVSADAAAPPRAYGLVAAAFAVVAAYVALLPLLGFRIATVVFVAAFQLLLERPSTVRQWAMLVAIALGTSVITYVLFNDYLLVLLPRGLWINW